MNKTDTILSVTVKQWNYCAGFLRMDFAIVVLSVHDDDEVR